MVLPNHLHYKQTSEKPILKLENGKEVYGCPFCSKIIRKNLANYYCHIISHTHPRCPVCNCYMIRNNSPTFPKLKYTTYLFYKCNKCKTVCLIPKEILGKGYLKPNHQT